MTDRTAGTDSQLLREDADASLGELYRRHAPTVYAWFEVGITVEGG